MMPQLFEHRMHGALMSADQFDIHRELESVLALGQLTSADTGGRVKLSGADPMVDSVFRLGAIAAVGRMAPAVAAAAIWNMRGGAPQDLSCDLGQVIHELDPKVTLNGYPPRELQSAWVHASGYADNFVPARNGRLVSFANVYPVLQGAMTDAMGIAPHHKAEIRERLRDWDALELERAAAKHGACAVMVRSEAEWAAEEQAQVLAALPVVQIDRMGDSPPEPLSRNPARPLSGVRALGLSRVLAGATIGTALAEQGADALNIWSPESFETFAAYAYAHMGMRPAWVPEKTPAGKERLRELLRGADIVFENRREGVMARRGLDVADCMRLRPGIIHVSLRSFGHEGPWADRVGFDTPVLCALGAAVAEGSMEAPRKPPMTPINDWVAGWFGAFGAMAALRLRALHGGSYRVRVSLARSCMWWMAWPRIPRGARGAALHPLGEARYYTAQTPLGEYRGIACQVNFSRTQPYYDPVLESIGSAKPEWLARA
jgi:hypothetical protein